MSLKLAEIAQSRTVRLIPTAYYKPPVLRALVKDDSELDMLAALEGQTSRRQIAPVVSVGADYDAWGRSFISAAFSYRRRGGNRFNDETRGAWYAGFDDRTALTEVAFHKTLELGYINHFRDDVRYQALHASFIGRFHDARAISPAPDYLSADINVGYPAGQALARTLMAAGSRGLIYPSVRHPGGVCIAAFQPNVVQDVCPGARWRIVWAGTPQWSATTD